MSIQQAVEADIADYDDPVFSVEIHPRAVVRWALAVEGGLFAAAIAGGLLCGVRPWLGMEGSPGVTAAAIGVGLVAGLIFTAAGIVCERLPGRAMEAFRRYIHTQIAPVFARCSRIQLALIAVAAGLGEEVFFRGWMQQGLAVLWPGTYGAVAAVLLSALAFGACHSLTRLYFVLATVGGVLFGLLFLCTQHIAAPVIAHAVYDFLMLLYLAPTASAGGQPTGAGDLG